MNDEQTANSIEDALKLMTERRQSLLQDYLASLLRPDWGMATSGQAIETAGRVHDCDRHITNLMMELKRIRPYKNPVEPKKDVTHAS